MDFANALEAALLSGTTTELSFRFALYGALFLRDQYDARQTFDRLTNVYRVRSQLVHGSRVNAAHRASADKDAADLAKAVVLKSVEMGWPDKEILDQAAIGVRLT